MDFNAADVNSYKNRTRRWECNCFKCYSPQKSIY